MKNILKNFIGTLLASVYSLILVAGFASPVYADDIAMFSFVTDPRTVAVGALSEAITVQSQNSVGLSQSIPETFDLVFQSSSATGQFLNSSGNPVSTTMSKNTANRTFYYKDSTAGDFTLSVTATGRDSGKSFTATQHIFVGVDNPNPPVEETDDEDDTGSTSSSSQSSSPSTSSAHSSPAPLSDSNPKVEFEISAGRDRLGSVGNRLTFKAVATRADKIDSKAVVYTWVFGDGTTATGELVSHAYAFPGKYSIVLNGFYSDKEAVSRATVQIISPEISLDKVDGGTLVRNASSQEINLDGWKLRSGVRQFTFPVDTLIPAKETIVFSDRVTGLGEGQRSIENPFGKEVAVASTTGLANSAARAADIIDTDDIKAKLASAQDELFHLYLARDAVARPDVDAMYASADKEIVPNLPPVEESGTDSSAEILTDNQSSATDQLANVVSVFEAPAKQSFVSAVLSWPAKGFHFIKRLFVEE